MIRKQLLDNGLTVISESMPQVRSVAIGFWLRRGSRDEPAKTNGISHFIEHLVFKGTRNRSARELALTMDSIGGQMDAFTSKEYTCFYAKVLDEHLPVAVELLADIVQNPLFDRTELERERKVVLEEIRMVRDTPDDLIFDLFADRFYPDHPLGRPIQGTEKTVGALSRRQLQSFFHGVYRPNNMLVVAAGNIRHGQLSRLARKHLGQLEPGKPKKGSLGRPDPRGGLFKRARNQLEQLHLLFGLPAFSADLEGRYPLYVLNTILGGTMSSRLFQKIREERGLAYSVYSSVNSFVDTGFLNVYVGTSPKSGDEVVRLVLDELRALRDRGVEPRELEVAKEHLKGSLMLSLESTSSRMSNLARQQIYYGRQLSLEETLSGVERVTQEDVQRVARELFSDRRVALAAVGRLERLRIRRGELKI